MCRIKVEVTPDERAALTPTARAVIHGYEGGVNGEILCYAIEEILAEKLRTLRQTDVMLASRGWHRPRVRDYYDLWKVLSTFGATIDAATVRRILPPEARHPRRLVPRRRGLLHRPPGPQSARELAGEARAPHARPRPGRPRPLRVPGPRGCPPRFLRPGSVRFRHLAARSVSASPDGSRRIQPRVSLEKP